MGYETEEERSFKEESAYTKQLCEKCGKEVKMGFGFALMNLDKPTLCENCK